ncbi:MAG: NAD-dependent epimerase/dehydratase family protein, partial [Caldilineaceae bacterium]|nr:NAD-dependent epimerase/dehydratase family protein [Caldilineaceae bacterium]
MHDQKVLITGATGFTGGHLCRALVARGYAVRALVRDEQRAADLRALGVELIPGDLRDRAALQRAVQGVEAVYHIAALFRQENVTRQEMWAINADGTRNLLDAAAAAGVGRFVHCSTIGVHGAIKQPPATEESPYGPGDDYQESKTAGEKVALQYMAEARLPITIFRPGGIYGPGDLRFLKLFRTIQQRKFIMFGSGKVLYQLVYIDDLINGILLCGSKAEALGQVYILTGAAPVTLNELVQQIAQVVGVPSPRWHLPVMPLYLAGFACELLCKPLGIAPPLYRRRVDFFRKDRAFSIQKAQTQLGFAP